MEYPDPSACLASTESIDSDAPEIQAAVDSLDLGDASPAERAVAIFNHVRDSIEYEFGFL